MLWEGGICRGAIISFLFNPLGPLMTFSPCFIFLTYILPSLYSKKVLIQAQAVLPSLYSKKKYLFKPKLSSVILPH